MSGDHARGADAATAPARPPSVHPGPATVTLTIAMRDALIAHARAGYPNEACGLIVGAAEPAAGGHPGRFVPTRNAAASPYRYEIHADDLLRVSLAADDADQVIWGIVHSHVRSPARPSPTDLGLAFYPDALYLLVSLAESEVDRATGLPRVRAWRIVGGEAFEVALVFA